MIEIDGRHLDYRLIQGRGGSELVFLHEGLGSMGLWRAFPDEMAKATGRRCLVYSRAGHGWSDVVAEPRRPDFMHHEALVVLPLLLRELGLSSPVLIGHSDGASIALIHAGAGHPVSALVLLAPHVFVEPESIAGIEAARERFETGDLAERMGRHHRDPHATFRGWSEIWLNPAFRDWNIEDSLPRITCPTLLIQGVDDEYGTRAQLDAIEKGLVGPVQRLVLDDSGHAPHVARPEPVLEAITRFLAENAPGTAG